MEKLNEYIGKTISGISSNDGEFNFTFSDGQTLVIFAAPC
jgi:hypothetical protein